jgi:hypothetical protein
MRKTFLRIRKAVLGYGATTRFKTAAHAQRVRPPRRQRRQLPRWSGKVARVHTPADGRQLG